MSSSTNSSLTYIGQQIVIYGGLIILAFGVIGGLFSIIIFLSLETFRQSSCAFYLTIMSIVNIGQLVFGLLSRIMISGYGVDWTTISLVYCKFRLTFFELCSLMSYSCLCLATIDQYFATCTRPHWQQWSNIKLAHRLISICFISTIIFLIPYPIYFQHIILTTGKISCATTNVNVLQYINYFINVLLGGYIPDFILVLFAVLAYRNIKQIAYRAVPLVRRELDKQLTTMVFVQVIINLFTNIPFVTFGVISFATSNIQDAVFMNIIQFISIILLIIYYTYFASPFYIYMCVSERFRRQFSYVVFDIYINRWWKQTVPINQIVPT